MRYFRCEDHSKNQVILSVSNTPMLNECFDYDSPNIEKLLIKISSHLSLDQNVILFISFTFYFQSNEGQLLWIPLNNAKKLEGNTYNKQFIIYLKK